MSIVLLRDAADWSQYGGKAAQLSGAVHAGLPVPAGLGYFMGAAERIAACDANAVKLLLSRLTDIGLPVAVRSSVVDEDGVNSSYAGIFKTVLNVAEKKLMLSAVCEVCISEYRRAGDVGRRNADNEAYAGSDADAIADADADAKRRDGTSL